MDSSRHKSTRRQFLKGRSAVDALSDVGRALAPEVPLDSATAASETRSFLVQVGRRAMACEFDVYLNGGEHEAATEKAIEALDLIDRLEDQLSVYRHRSEVTQLNRLAAQRPVSVEAGLFDLLAEAVSLHKTTEGAFDMTAGPLIEAWGLLRREGRMPTQDELECARQVVGCQLELSSDRRTVRFLRPGVQINLGGIGKGYALDRCSDVLTQNGVRDFMIHGGHSSILARGHRKSPQGNGWTVGIRNPLRPDRRLAEITLRDKSIGTSGTGTQHFYHEGRRYGHIIDPRTGQPAEGVLSTTVVAPRATLADALSTAFYIMGVDRVREYCQQHADIGALIIRSGKQAGAIETIAVGLRDDEWQLVGEQHVDEGRPNTTL